MTPGADRQYEPTPWYAEGLRFACLACGRCCGGAPGYVWVDKEGVAAMASHLGMTARQFRRQYVRRLWRGLCLKEKSNYDCVLLDADGRCVAYEVRPLQCRTWPFWPTNLVSRRAWDDAARRCPGMNSGPLYRLEQIEILRMEMDA
jgi:Fe-S-cluster containining protein